MDVREKLVELLSYFADGYSVENRHIVGGQKVCKIADHLIANGVTIPVPCKDCTSYGSNGWCWKLGTEMNKEDFCSFGERRGRE